MKNSSFSLPRQRGMTLMELMVGLFIGLLVTAVAMSALMVSRQVGGAVSDSSDIQQQAAYAMRLIGQQIRQANVTRVALYPCATEGMKWLCNNEEATSHSDAFSPVVLIDEVQYRKESWPFKYGVENMESTKGAGLRTVFINVDDLKTEVEKKLWSGNCLGDDPGGAVYSHFIFEGTELKCASSSSGKQGSDDYQPVLRNVADFQVRYLIHDTSSGDGAQKIKYATAAEINGMGNDWKRVQGVEICLTLFGKEPTPIPEDASYQGCAGPKEYSAIPAGDERKDRPHLTFRSIFQARNSQGKPTPGRTST